MTINWRKYMGKTKTEDYDLDDLRAIPGRSKKVRYRLGEYGWVKVLGDGRAVILNVPVAEDLLPFDVVTLKPADDGGLEVGRVVWRAFDKKTSIKYPTPHRDNFERIAEALREEGFVVEGLTRGHLGVAHQEKVDLKAILQDANVDTSQLTFRDWGTR